MHAQEVEAATAAERHGVAEWLAGLDEASLRTASLCSGWDVRTVGAHLAVAVTAGLPAFFAQALRHCGLHRANDAMARAFAQRPVSEIVGALRANAHRRLRNPGVGSYGPLADVLVHLGDMRLPLGLPYAPQPDRVLAVLSFLTSGRAFGFVRRQDLAGLRLVAEDVDFARGAGEQVHGRAADLVMAVCGRTAVLADLDGPGVELLAARLQA